jgi:hypothetical protein
MLLFDFVLRPMTNENCLDSVDCFLSVSVNQLETTGLEESEERKIRCQDNKLTFRHKIDSKWQTQLKVGRLKKNSEKEQQTKINVYTDGPRYMYAVFLLKHFKWC